MRISDWSSDVCSSDLGRTGAASERLRDAIDIAGAEFTPVARRGVARGFAGEFGMLELGISGHPAILIATRQLEHAAVELVEARERVEPEFVYKRAQPGLDTGDGVSPGIGSQIE